jgi:hypothetical protein
MFNSIITRTRRSWINHFANVNEDPIENEIVTSSKYNARYIFLRTTQMYIVLQIVFIL